MKRRFILGVCICIVSLLFAAPSTYTSGAPAQVLRVICLPSRPLALTVALEQGLLAKYGVQADVRVAANSEELRNALASGTADVAHAAVDNAVALAENAHLGVIVVLGGEGSTNELIAQPAIPSMESLRGRTVIVDAPTTAYAIQLKKMLLLHGLHAGQDYEIKPVGGTPIRLAAMREHKEYAASILGPPASLIAKREGFVSLGTTQQALGPYQAGGAFVQREWATQNKLLLTAYLAAVIEGQRWILNPANKAQVVALLEKEFKLSEELAQEAYASWIAAPGGFEPDAKLDLDAFRNVLKLREEIEHTWSAKIPEPETYYDQSYFDAAVSKIPAAK